MECGGSTPLSYSSDTKAEKSAVKPAHSKTKPATDPSLGRTVGRLGNFVFELRRQLATAHRPTVPPNRERAVIIAITD